MQTVSYKKEDSFLIISLSGRIDSANAPAVEKEIEAAVQACPADAIRLDLDQLEYISSAGLRVILRLKRRIADTGIINARPEVYDILEMTGFTELMEVRKAYRVVSVDGCEIIGQGANGKVYRIDSDTIVKVYLNSDALPEIQRERELARAAFVAGVPTAIPYDVVRIESGGYGSVFELLNASSFASLLISGEKTVDEIAKMSIDLLKLIHSRTVTPGTMPDMKLVALDWADFLRDHLPAEQYEKLHALIDAVPEDLHMLHGDYHLKNIMLQDGECLLIDMDTLCYGHPIFELASMYNAYHGYFKPRTGDMLDFLGISYETAEEIWQKSLALYLGTSDEKTCKAVEEKASIVGLTRVMRRSIRRNGLNTEDGQKTIAYCRETLAKLLPVTESLLF